MNTKQKGANSVMVDSTDPLNSYNVVWMSPSKDSSGSMPIGNGEMGLNVWVEPNGDLVFLCGRTDSWDENMRLCKLGRVRIKFTPSLTASVFKQTLHLRQGEIVIHGGPADSAITVRVWPDAHHPVAYVEAESQRDFQMQVALEVWRDQERMCEDEYQLSSPAKAYPDVVLTGQKDQVVWYHRNPASYWRDTLELQGLQSAIAVGQDPLLHRTFGGLLRGKGLVRADDRTLRTAAPRKQVRLALHTHTLTPATEAVWLAAIERNAAAVDAVGIIRARAAHRRWWKQFWNRSWIRASGTPDAEAATQAYVLQRFVTAGGGRGHYPIKPNGSIFTVDGGVYKDKPRDADFRAWGGCYWFQNTRLSYWPMLASGDSEMMRPLFRMYKDALPLGRLRSQIYFNHDGCFFPETITFWGTYANSNWGERKGGHPGDPIPNGFIRYHYNGTLELLAMMLDTYAYTGDKEFLQQDLLPMADEFLTWWDRHWPRDASGCIRMAPSNALETYWGVANPAQDIAGLAWDLDRLLALTNAEIGTARRARWRALRKAVPPLPSMTHESKTVLAPCEAPPQRSNAENPELYAVFPFRIYGLGKPDLPLALDTFNSRIEKKSYSWFQDDTQAAYLGLATVARDCLVDRVRYDTRAYFKESRFFRGSDGDWFPDQDHGGNLLMAMQAMLVQADGNRILVLPAWPKEWNVEFKLHVPQRTVVEGVYRGGKLQKLKVTPRKRARDIVKVHGT